MKTHCMMILREAYTLPALVCAILRVVVRLMFTGPALLTGLLLLILLSGLLVTGTAGTALESWLQREAVAWRSAPDGYIMQERCRVPVSTSSGSVPAETPSFSGQGPIICEQIPVSLHDHARETLAQMINMWGGLSVLTLFYELIRILRLRACREADVICLRSSLYRYKDE